MVPFWHDHRGLLALTSAVESVHVARRKVPGLHRVSIEVFVDVVWPMSGVVVSSLADVDCLMSGPVVDVDCTDPIRRRTRIHPIVTLNMASNLRTSYCTTFASQSSVQGFVPAKILVRLDEFSEVR